MQDSCKSFIRITVLLYLKTWRHLWGDEPVSDVKRSKTVKYFQVFNETSHLKQAC